MEDLETSATIEFHGARYVVTVQVQQQLLHVQVEAADANVAPSSVWTGKFPASDVEQLTRQTGNSKRFPVFVQMLLTALHRRSDTVFVDLLTAADLNLYRQRKLQPGAVSEGLTSAATATSTGKRYLILTYAVEFDRVHYPLPLTHEVSPSPEVLQRTIRRLRQALAEKENFSVNGSNTRLSEENTALKEENRCLKNTLKQYCDNASIEENKELIALYQQFREDSAVETARLRTEIKQLRLASQQNDRSELARQEQERLETRRKIAQEHQEPLDADNTRPVQLSVALIRLRINKKRNESYARPERVQTLARVRHGPTEATRRIARLVGIRQRIPEVPRLRLVLHAHATHDCQKSDSESWTLGCHRPNVPWSLPHLILDVHVLRTTRRCLVLVVR
ncbi:MORN repeat-containing protein 3 [Phytophthora nicotianae]|uniref:MORN repeat-containing protein 3 n=1 Tax=Phytophthora nicotianae TaxID=4792 RepID=A0A0W8DCY4_PHYNI|nr:MORN repeat-containing protein 3 [Phytophthora nicotianae]